MVGIPRPDVLGQLADKSLEKVQVLGKIAENRKFTIIIASPIITHKLCGQHESCGSHNVFADHALLVPTTIADHQRTTDSSIKMCIVVKKVTTKARCCLVSD